MTANELRIGNRVFCKMENDDIQIELDAMYDVRHYMPIPLTEEWLLRMGFKKTQRKSFVLGGAIKLKFAGTDGYYNLYILGKQVTTLGSAHQLQNLYFALTGNELTIKEQ